MGKFTNQTTKINIMKNQQNIVQAMKCCLSNGKFALLFISIFFLFTSCKQSGSQNSESISDQVSNLISSSPCDKFIGKYSRQQTASSITTTSNIEFKKDQDFYKLFFTANSTTNNPSLQMAVNITNERFKATFPSDGIVCTCNDKGNIEINVDGKKVESMIDNSGNLIYGGLTFYKTNNKSKSVATEEVTEETTIPGIEAKQFEDMSATDEELDEIETQSIPFVGKREFYTFSKLTNQISWVEIKQDGDVIFGLNSRNSSEKQNVGKYKPILKTNMYSDGTDYTYFKILKNRIIEVDKNGNTLMEDYCCDNSSSNEPCPCDTELTKF